MPEPQRGASRWMMLAVVAAIVVALIVAKDDESDESNGPGDLNATATASSA